VAEDKELFLAEGSKIGRGDWWGGAAAEAAVYEFPHARSGG
jgi:hypothetical protein